MMAKQAWQASPRYRALKQRVLQAQGGCCADCGLRGSLELHHERYPLEWGEEEDWDVVCLCRTCHHGRHCDINGDFWADPQEKEMYWDSFWEATDKD
jgi:hypothetical protein